MDKQKDKKFNTIFWNNKTKKAFEKLKSTFIKTLLLNYFKVK